MDTKTVRICLVSKYVCLNLHLAVVQNVIVSNAIFPNTTMYKQNSTAILHCDVIADKVHCFVTLPASVYGKSMGVCEVCNNL